MLRRKDGMTSGGKDCDYMEFCRDYVDKKEKEVRGDDMLLKDFVSQLGYDINEFKVEALPQLIEVSSAMRKVKQNSDLIDRIHGKNIEEKTE
ncbi:MAG: hypothetical protein L0F96_03445 [Lactococcus lactis]|nr:hypothetical protein [Lactococcus lactis]